MNISLGGGGTLQVSNFVTKYRVYLFHIDFHPIPLDMCSCRQDFHLCKLRYLNTHILLYVVKILTDLRCEHFFYLFHTDFL